MISVEEATSIISSHRFQPAVSSVRIHQAVGRVLAEEVTSDRDIPPFDRVTMDGIAIAYQSWKDGQRKFRLEGIHGAGQPAKILGSADNAIEVMTGAVLPSGTDTVIRYEDLKIEAGIAHVVEDKIERMQSIHRQGQDAVKGQVLLSPGMVLSPAEIALLASVGKSEIGVYQYPVTALVASGDELVAVDSTPLPHQVRRSNTYALEAAMNAIGWPAKQFHFRDEREELTKSLGELLDKFQLIVLSGGVSKGAFDFVPSVLEDLGVRKLFHHVSQRPGKPFWFGVSDSGKIVFALPGNPVSTFMCFYKYIRPWVFECLGVSPKPGQAILARDFSFQPKLTCFLQVSIRNEHGKRMAYPEAGGGSGDFANLKNVDGFLELPADRSEFKAGEAFPFIAFRV